MPLYSFWVVFVLIVAGVTLKIRSTKAKYLLEKAEEQKQAESEARTSRTTAERRAREHLYTQPGSTQGQSLDYPEMLGTQGQKGKPN